MAANFEVDFGKLMSDLAKVQAGFESLGAKADNAERKLAETSSTVAKLLKAVEPTFDRITVAARGAGVSVDGLNKILGATEATLLSSLARLNQQTLSAQIQAKAWKGELKELKSQLQATAELKSYIKFAEKTANLAHELANQNKFLAAQIKALGTEEGRTNLIRKASLASQGRQLTAAHQMALANKELKQQEELLGSMYGKANAVLKARIAETVKVYQEEIKLTAKLAEHQRAEESLTGGILRQITAQKERNKGLEQAITFEQRERNAVDELIRRQASLSGGLAEQAAVLKAVNQAREKEITELTRERAKIEELNRTLASLNGGEQEQIARLNAKIAARRKAIAEDGRAVAKIEELTASAARQIVAEQRAKEALEARNRATLEAARATQAMSKSEAEAVAKAEALAAANKKATEALLDEARKAHGMSKAQRELTQNRDREIERLERLKAQRDLLNSSYGRELAAIQRQIQEQQRYNRMLSMTTAELLGFTNAQRRNTATLQAGAQTAAMMRAALSGLHTNIGMYTSATILAASSTYAIASALRSAVEVGAEFTATMARTDAIMSTSGPSWLPDTGTMAAVEMQVRALGQSTMYTASEVAQGLTELGQAGLSAGDAMVALRPSLDLAMIGGIDMAKSADIATNVMMTFGMQAKDLAEVVDVMATAVTNSNTNIEQLANALTYAGPAAHTAGVSMRDTVAAVEALANSGIKASRSGTALRRLFVSILNPTEKGAAMMQRYGISVLDAEGKTRGLVDIVGQLSTKLKGLSGADRLSAIQDLVGVYATSPIAALVDQADNLVHLRRQLDDTAGAAERMRDKIEDGLKFDWKQVLSAFEEVKLQAFDAYEMQMREASARLASWLTEITQPVKTLSDGSTITELDLILKKAEAIGEALAWGIGGVMGAKLVGALGSGFSALSADTQKASERLGVFTQRMRESSAAHLANAGAANTSAGALQRYHYAVSAAAAGTGLLSAGASRLATALHWVGVAGNFAMKAFGWAGVLFGLYQAFDAIFNQDAEQEILDQRNSVDSLKSSYDALKESMQQTALAKERQALSDQVKADLEAIRQLEGEKGTLEVSIARNQGMGLPTQNMEARLSSVVAWIEKYKNQVEGARQTLLSLQTTQADQSTAMEREIAASRDATKAYADWQAKLAEADERSKGGIRNLRLYDEADRLKAIYDAAVASAKQAAQETLAVNENLVSLQATIEQATQSQRAAANRELFEKNASAAEKLVVARGELLQVERQLAELAQQDNAAIASGDESARPGQDEVNRLLSRQEELILQEQQLAGEAKKSAEDLAAAKEALAEFYMTEDEKLEHLRQTLEDVMLQRIINNSLVEEGGILGAQAAMAEVERLKEELRLRQAIQSAEDKKNKPKRKTKTDAERGAEKLAAEAKRKLDQAMSAYDALRQKFDPLGASAKSVSEKTAQMDLLLAKGKITLEERAMAVSQLSKEHYELTLEQDKNYQSLLSLREAYGAGDSAMVKHAEEMAKLNRLYAEGTAGQMEYLRIKQRISEAGQRAVLDGLPEANLPSDNTLSTPFSDSLNVHLERAQGLQTFRDRGDQMTSDWHDGYAAINAEYEAQAAALAARELKEEEHQRRLTEIQQEAQAKRNALNEQFTADSNLLADQRLQYEEQMSKVVLSSMLGTAESIFGMFASAGEEATAAQKAAFAAMKAFAVAQIIVNTEIAASKAMAAPDVMLFGQQVSAQAAIRAMGYASAGLVAGTALAQIGGAGKSSGGSSYSGMYDKGGYIPYGSYGVVGEYGPEIVSGPAQVTGRERTARKLGGSEEFSITLAPNITVQVSGGQEGNATEQGKQLAATVRATVMSTLSEQMRPNGALDTWIKNQRNR